MEFQSSLTPLFRHASLTEGVDFVHEGDHLLSVWSSKTVERLRDRTLQEQLFGTVVNQLGVRSATAQELKAVITSYAKFQHSQDRIYLHVTLPSTVNGILRIGEKRLFIRDELGTIKEITPSCVLDFYVAESKQRAGYGKQLFEFMLRTEKGGTLTPAKFGYDRPSSKLLAFLARHYNLSSFVPQNNNFVVFRKYFAKDAPPSASPSVPQSSRQTDAPYAGRRTGGNVENHSPTRRPQQQQQPTQSHQSFMPHASPPPGQASFAHYDSQDTPGRQLHFDDSRSDVPAAASSGASSRQPSYGSSQQFDDHSSYRRSTPPDGANRLAKTGSHILSGTPTTSTASRVHLHQSPQQQQQQQPAHRLTQYHSHNILTGYQPSTGHSNFANQRSSPAQPANFLPDGMHMAPLAASSSELSIERKAYRSGVPSRPLLDPAPNGLKRVDQSIDHLERAIREKEASLTQHRTYATSYRVPNERDPGWSRHEAHLRRVHEAPPAEHPASSPHQNRAPSPLVSESQARYADPRASTQIGGAQSMYSNPIVPAPVAGRSPFAYGGRR